MPKENKPVDWDGIERDFVAGIMSVREIARWYGVSHTAINKKARADGWVRERQPGHIRRERPKALSGEVLPPPVGGEPKAEELPERGRKIAAQLMDELETVTSHVGELEDMICSEESDPRRRQALLKALSLSERSTTLKNLSAAVKTLNEVAPQGKKAARQGNAEKASTGGKFGVPPAPRLAVDNTR